MPERIWFKQFYLDQLLPLASNACFNCKRASLSPEEAFSANHASGVATTCLQCKGISPYIAEHRGSNPPPSMMLSAVDKAGHVSTNLIRSWSFSLPELEDEIKRDIECKQLNDLGSCEMDEEQMPDTSHHPSSDVGSGLPK